MYNIDIIRCCVGYGIGAWFGFLFIRSSTPAPSFFNHISSVFLFVLRYASLGLLSFSLLHSPTVMIILTVTSFFMGFWTIIIRKKVTDHEQS